MHFDSEDEEFSESKYDTTPNEIFNPLPKRAHMHALTRLLQECHSINFIEEDLCYQLGIISEKLHRYQTTFKGQFGSNVEIISIGKCYDDNNNSNGQNNAQNVKWIRERVGDAIWDWIIKRGKFLMMSYVSSFNNM